MNAKAFVYRGCRLSYDTRMQQSSQETQMMKDQRGWTSDEDDVLLSTEKFVELRFLLTVLTCACVSQSELAVGSSRRRRQASSDVMQKSGKITSSRRADASLVDDESQHQAKHQHRSQHHKQHKMASLQQHQQGEQLQELEQQLQQHQHGEQLQQLKQQQQQSQEQEQYECRSPGGPLKTPLQVQEPLQVERHGVILHDVEQVNNEVKPALACRPALTCILIRNCGQHFTASTCSVYGPAVTLPCYGPAVTSPCYGPAVTC
ncbi:cytoplasmic polyadenylation element-binding protein-like [Hyalella azteca]|uniref:Cytoplasmic polyadenylation element-binding protein-like n=1 Tax=Hyalella azteca TaxID=294128 RepID=A0A979FLU1_HYAAZ|nr:cytoplasmic polyadenylation element-binding protein-like [Hyalella azteca]